MSNCIYMDGPAEITPPEFITCQTYGPTVLVSSQYWVYYGTTVPYIQHKILYMQQQTKKWTIANRKKQI